MDVTKIPKFNETLKYFAEHEISTERRGLVTYNQHRVMYTNNFQGTVRIKFRNALDDNDELLILLRKSKIELTYATHHIESELMWHTLSKKEGTLPVDDNGPETLDQYMFIDDTFGIDYSAYQCILAIHEKYYDRLRDRLI
ncbi:TPA: hypothetical protein NV758_001366 [Escherichia coli]|uniref:hypothetical protein n=1 Tax=Escherichia coli TaxID=562 RepID=UPI000A2EA9F8|nr:hypothetical protein [Escherichia coli]MED6573305.1 hypothetical protein [Escherichia coli O157]QDF13914.1 hypothetical protein vBEcoMphAPEC6_gp289c [Escherichia phage vB_EcoM_phAPEC6]WIL00788.1 hypothetical protein [Escherichia phage vB_EcoM_CRJP21]ELQ3159259.1 hypothetical protein [Escherichia coli]